MKKIKEYIKVVKLDEVQFLATHLAFYLIFILIPIVSFIGILSKELNINIENIIFYNNIPKTISILLLDSVNQNNNFNIILFSIISLFLASRGSKAIIVSSNILFKIKEKNILKVRIKALIITIVLFMLIGFIIMVPVLGDIMINYITSIFKDNITIYINSIYQLLKYPITLLLMFILIKILYIMSSPEEINTKYTNIGSIWTTTIWFIFSRIYSIYLNNYNNYYIYYGNLSSILILFIWIYLLSYIFIVGLSLNANKYLKETN